jgi:transcriptional regulator with XRE-family HTH domain
MLDSKEIGQQIRKCRKEKKLTQKNLANILGVAESTIQKYEYGTVHSIPSTVLNQLADALEVSVWTLLGVSKNEAYSEAINYHIMGDFYEDENEKRRGELLLKIVNSDKNKGKLSKIVKTRMKMLNMSFEELSNITQIPLTKLNSTHYFDNPDITLNDLTLLSNALDVSLDYLIGDECINLPISYYKNILGLANECGVDIKFDKLCNWFDISYKNTKISTDYITVKKLKDEILAFTKFKITELFKEDIEI